ncbi:hypothetical protein GKZ90_0021070 [Flavobacterium sp. MC2016-06]|jgi:hypothetical protein|uniref:hypothetical protein n=1 Tax=Flavobacterium sp. MC2016-06 TaxID=2676308 RepID=UPI0012BA57AF|nr:hypothetical protein [Flavobacterium sp. MC2016-06]MBU3860993.1 hypothetical protein [Flavobacterium sp. MC2016-06]
MKKAILCAFIAITSLVSCSSEDSETETISNRFDYIVEKTQGFAVYDFTTYNLEPAKGQQVYDVISIVYDPETKSMIEVVIGNDKNRVYPVDKVGNVYVSFKGTGKYTFELTNPTTIECTIAGKLITGEYKVVTKFVYTVKENK